MKKQLIITVMFIINMFFTSITNAQQWTTNGTNIHNANTGNVGVGTTTPAAKFQVIGESRLGASGNYVKVNSSGVLSFTGTGSIVIGDNKYAFKHSGGGNRSLFINKANNRFEFRDSTGNDLMHVDYYNGNSFISGKLGIGTITPQYGVHAIGDGGFSGNIIVDIGNINNGGISNSLRFGTFGTGFTASISSKKTAGGNLNGLDFNIGLSTRMSITSTGDVGIGTTAPGAKLEVAGQVKITGGTPGAGKVLTSDANGLATWQTPAAGTVTGSGSATRVAFWNTSSSLSSSSNLYWNNVNGRLGIGITTPDATLHVVGSGGRFDGSVWVDGGNSNNGTTLNTIHFGDFFSTGEAIGSKRSIGGNQNGLDFYTNNSARMAITNSGDIGVGTSSPAARLDVMGNIALNGNELRLQGGGDGGHGLKYIASGVDGPYLFGFNGGALGTAGLPHSLVWNYNGDVGITNTLTAKKMVVDAGSQNNANLDSNALVFGSGSGEGIASKRTAGGNQYGLDFYTDYTSRLTLTSAGHVGFGISAPLSLLHVFKGASGQTPDANSNLVLESNANNYLNFLTPVSNENGVLFGLTGNSANGGIVYNAPANLRGMQFRTGGNGVRMVIDSTGRVGIGTSNPSKKLTVYNGTIKVTAVNNLTNGLEANANNNSTSYAAVYGHNQGSGPAGWFIGGGGLAMLVTGNVGINTITPSHALDVCGTIRGTEIRVENGIGWCDYVFKKDYKLKSLTEVEEFILENGHLEGIVPASVIEKEGIKLGEMSKAMMEKIEELTLYVIQLDKENKKLKDEMILLKKH